MAEAGVKLETIGELPHFLYIIGQVHNKCIGAGIDIETQIWVVLLTCFGYDCDTKGVTRLTQTS